MRRSSLILLTLVAATLAAYWQVGENKWVGYDDPDYVFNNPMVNQGLRGAAVLWAFSSVHAANWHPLTSLSHMADCSLFDLDPGPPHWVNLGWHVLNVVLVFVVWRSLSGAVWPSALVAGLFALHPLHVESVAWISERKDVLSTALWLLTLLAYARWVERPSRGRYALVLLGALLGMLAKPMVVTLPGTLLLLDYWPLRRWPGRSWGALLWEKIPFIVGALALAGVTLWVQRETGATDFGEKLGFGARLGNALVSCVRYLGHTLWPGTLSPFYPHPGAWPWGAVAGASALLAAVSWLAWRERERRRWLFFGWSWYLGTLAPVLGLVQVGAQSMADRYTYVPLLGIFTVIAWAGAEAVQRRPGQSVVAAALAATVLIACAVRTAVQVPVWKTPVGLVEHMRAAVGAHEVIEREMGMALIVAERPEAEVMAAYRRGHELAPGYPFFLNELGLSAARQGRFDEAAMLIGQALRLAPRHPAPQAGLAGVLEMQGLLVEAESRYRQALTLQPRLGVLHRLLGMNLTRQGRLPEARDACLEATRGDRWDALAYNQLGLIYASLGRPADALSCLERAHWINPADTTVGRNLDALRRRRSEDSR